MALFRVANLDFLVQIGMSEILFLREYHPDAEGLFNNTMDLHKVVTTLKDTHVRLLKHVRPPIQH